MSDDVPEADLDQSADTATATEPEPYKLSLDVSMTSSGPCRKHVRVRVPRKDVEHYFNASVKEFVGKAQVPGFRAGRVPRKLVEIRFKKDVENRVKEQLLLDSLETIEKDHELKPINQPEMDFAAIEIPETGDFEYEFDVEVRPEFQLPDFSSLVIQKATREISDAEVADARKVFLDARAAIERVEEPAQLGDVVSGHLTFRKGEEVLGRSALVNIPIKPVLRLQDAEATGFGAAAAGVRAGESRTFQAVVSREAAKVELRNEPIDVELQVESVMRRKLPTLDGEFFKSVGVESAEELDSEVRSALERQLVYEQRQSTREQVMEKIVSSADWELPETLLRRQTENAMRREVLEMQQAGYSPAQIRSRENQLRQNSLSTTERNLKQHFILSRVAEENKIEVDPETLEMQLMYMAMQQGVSPRKLRSRFEKTGMMENLEAQVLEAKVIDHILSQVKYEETAAPRPESHDDVAAIEVGVFESQEEAPAPAAAE